MRDMRHRLREQRQVLLHLLGALHLRMGREGADPDRAAANLYAAELIQRVDVDEELGRRKPHVERRDEALPAREDARPLAMALEELESLRERARFRIGK